MYKIPPRPFVYSILITVFLYAPLLKAGFVYDDVWYLVRNPAVRTLAVASFFLNPATAAAPASGLSTDVYRPLGTLAMALAYRSWGLHAWAYHLACLLAHLMNGVLLWVVLKKILKDDQAALIGVLVFWWHAAQVQTVAWISQLPGLIGSAGFLVALNCFVGEDALSLAASVKGWAAFAVAVGCKETTVILPLVAWLFWDRRVKDRLRYGAGLAGIAIIYIVGRHAVLPHMSQFADGNGPFCELPALGLLAFPVYLAKILFPISLRVSYGYPAVGPIGVMLSALLLITYVGAIAYWRGRAPVAAKSMGWILAGLLPVLQIIPIRAFVAERFLYIPLMGAGLFVGWLWQRFTPLRIWIVLWIVYLTARTAVAVPAWQSEKTLWAEAVCQEPANAFAHACYAESLGDDPRAEREYFQVLLHHPAAAARYAAFQNLASLHHQWGHTWKAEYWRGKAEKAKAGS